jgi:8-oxo-dGTP pyrophosphatase MutT (NUDIX family)
MSAHDSYRAWLVRQADRSVAAGTLLRTTDGRVLILRPTYKPGWTIPGGVAEHGELPAATARRETREETGIDVTVGRLLVVDHKAVTALAPASIHFVFDATADSALDHLTPVLPEDEIADWQLAPPEAALRLLNAPLANRVAIALQALQDGRTYYLEDGRLHAG